MKFKKIVGFGDSWMWGDELVDPDLVDHPHAHPVLDENTPYREQNCFLGLLGQHYQVPTENFGIAGGSMQSAIWTYLWWLQHESLDPSECLILVGHTDPNRQTFYNPRHQALGNDPPWNRFVHSAWVHSGYSALDPNWIQMAKLHMTLTDCRQVNKLNTHQSLLFFEGQYHSLAQNVIQFYTMQSHYPIKGLSSLYYPSGALNNYVGSDRTKLAPMGHPNEKGHQVIADQLIIEVDRAIINA